MTAVRTVTLAIHRNDSWWNLRYWKERDLEDGWQRYGLKIGRWYLSWSYWDDTYD